VKLVATGRDKPEEAVGAKIVGISAASVHFDRVRHEKAEVENVRLAEERHLRHMQFERHKTQAIANSAIQQAEFESQLEWQRSQAKVKKATQEQIAWQRDKDARDRANHENIAAQLKLCEDIVKNVASQFPSDFADIPIFFESIENVFNSVEVLVELRAQLLLPHLSKFARSLLLRLDHKRQRHKRHNTLLHRLRKSYGLGGRVHDWFRSYLSVDSSLFGAEEHHRL